MFMMIIYQTFAIAGAFLLPLVVCSGFVAAEPGASTPLRQRQLQEPPQQVGAGDVIISTTTEGGTEFLGTTESSSNSDDGDGVAVGLDVFRGIRYAAVPERFGASVPIVYNNDSSTNITQYRAFSFGPKCFQPPMGPPVPGSVDDYSEDCLYLNIYRPSGGTSREGNSSSNSLLLPVMVWVHGGGFVGGSGIEPVYDGSVLVARENVVVVTLNYRLGVFGTLTTDETGAGGMNFIQDQIHALQWVQGHITSFGGDPSKVTVFGESAGSTSICWLSVSPLASGLFRGAILQSGSCIAFNFAPLSVEEGWENTQAILMKGNYSSVDDLKALTPQELMTVGSFSWPAMDGYVIPQPPIELYESGKINPQHMIVGSNTMDDLFLLFLPAGAYMGRAAQMENEIHQTYDEEYGVEASQRCMEAYSPTEVYAGSYVTAYAQFRADSYFTCQGRELAAITASQGISTFLYYFGHYSDNDHAGMNNLMTMANLTQPSWASHTAEIAYVFGNLNYTYSGAAPKPPTRADAEVSRELMARWAAFARNGNPNPEEVDPDVVKWQPLPDNVPPPTNGASVSDVSALALLSIVEAGSGGEQPLALSISMTESSWKSAQCSAIPGMASIRTRTTVSSNDGGSDRETGGGDSGGNNNMESDPGWNESDAGYTGSSASSCRRWYSHLRLSLASVVVALPFALLLL